MRPVMEPPTYKPGSGLLRVEAEVAALHDDAQHPTATPGTGSAEHHRTVEPEHMPENPHQRRTRMVEAELAEPLRDFRTVVFGRMRQQHVVVHDLPQTDSAIYKMPLDVRKLHHQRELHRRDAEPLGNNFRTGDFTGQEALHVPVREGVVVPRRGPEVHLDTHRRRRMGQMEMVPGNIRKEPADQLVRIVRGNVILEKPHATEQGIDTFAAPLDPDVDIATLAHERIGIEARVRGPLEDGALAALRLEQPGEPFRLAIDELVLPPDGLRLARPLEHDFKRRLPVLRQLADTTIRNSQQGLLGSHAVKAGPVLCGQDIRELPRFAESNPQEIKETFVQTVLQ